MPFKFPGVNGRGDVTLSFRWLCSKSHILGSTLMDDLLVKGKRMIEIE